jgi:hypothetical protein
LALEI